MLLEKMTKPYPVIGINYFSCMYAENYKVTNIYNVCLFRKTVINLENSLFKWKLTFQEKNEQNLNKLKKFVILKN